MAHRVNMRFRSSDLKLCQALLRCPRPLTDSVHGGVARKGVQMVRGNPSHWASRLT